MDDFRAAFHGSVAAPRAPLALLIEREMGAAVTGLERVTRGYANEVYVADLAPSGRVVVRIRRRGGASFASERWAVVTARNAGVPVPEIYAVTVLDAGEALKVMLLSLVPGRPLGDVWPDLGETERRTVMRRVGVTLRALHAEVGG